jgi:hypothetical protein
VLARALTSIEFESHRGRRAAVDEMPQGQQPDNRLIDVLDHLFPRPPQGTGWDDEGLVRVYRIVGHHRVLSWTR